MGQGHDERDNLIEVAEPRAPQRQLYTYDQRNLMRRHSANPDGTGWDLQAAYGYDGNGDRLQPVDYTASTAMITTYTNDGLGLTQVLVADDGTNLVYNLM